jgi:hypothetical protein
MSLHLHIDHLVLEGTALMARDGAQLQAALGAELANLLRSGGLHPELAKGIALPSLPTPPMSLPVSPDPASLGRQIARQLAGSLTAQVRP